MQLNQQRHGRTGGNLLGGSTPGQPMLGPLAWGAPAETGGPGDSHHYDIASPAL